MSLATAAGRQEGKHTRDFSKPAWYERQVMNMSAYEIVMICISAMGLLIALIKLLNDLHK